MNHRQQIKSPITMTTTDNKIITSIITNGDISRLTPQQKVEYYKQFCEKLGLDPMLQPFRILRLNGREMLYCDRTGTQQLNKLYKVSHEIKAREVTGTCYVVTAQASTPDGRTTESIGAVSIGNMKGENLCNAMMKAETKAKRRATLDLLGLGMLDESEIPAGPYKGNIELTSIYANHPLFEGGVGGCPLATGIDEMRENDADDNGIPTSLFLTLNGLKKEVDRCTTEQELVTLYNDNKTRIDKEPKLKQLFTERKNELRKCVAA
ncbi:hypothetical protein [Polluticoccus soli]|uniref:hypothetical protein n=1 Tax=Polluticoccus soli TaxID=3034150 RepID=UPI0023E2D674|nr:hypothetical protein [Flavipsychrobacter sp. JY13-12]